MNMAVEGTRTRKTRSDRGQKRPQNSRSNSPRFIAAMASRIGSGHPIFSTIINYNHGIPYRLIKIGPTNKDWVKEHRFVMEQHLGRALDPAEHIHHINRDSLDNRIENLMIVSHATHQGLHSLISQNQWSTKFHCCQKCGTTSKKHNGHGLCTTCSQQVRFNRLGYWQ